MDMEISEKKTCYIYCRVSTEEQAQTGYSISAQEKTCREYAEKLNLLVLQVFKDEGESATAIDRPSFQKMLKQCEEEPVDIVIVWQTDRFARNELDHFATKDRLQKLGVSVLSVAQPLLDDSPEGRAMDGMMAIWNAYFSRDLSRKTKKGLVQKWDEGGWPSWAPLGYNNVKDKYDKGIVVIDPVTGPLIKWAFEQYATGSYSLLKLIKVLHNKGLRTRNGRPLAHSTMNQILANPFYYGLMRWNGKEKIGNHEALISKKLFDTCGFIAAKHRNFIIRERKHDFLLRGVIYCSLCGRRYTAERHPAHSKQRAVVSYYHCQKKTPCKAPYVEVDDLENEVSAYFKNIKFSKGFTDRLTLKVKKYLKDKDRDEAKIRRGYLNKRSALVSKRSVLEDRLLDDTIDRDSFRRIKDKLQLDIDSLDVELSKLESNRKFDFDLLEEVLSLTRNVPKTYSEAPQFLKRKYLNFFFEKIEVADKKVDSVVFSPLIQELIYQQEVILRTNLLPR